MSWQEGLLCSSHPNAAEVVAGPPAQDSVHGRVGLRTSLMAHLGHLGAWHGSEVAGGDSSAVQERGNSAEEERDTAKSSVADRRPWNLGETRHNGFEGADLNIPEAELSFASQIVVVVCRVGKLENSSDLVWRVRVCGDG